MVSHGLQKARGGSITPQRSHQKNADAATMTSTVKKRSRNLSGVVKRQQRQQTALERRTVEGGGWRADRWHFLVFRPLDGGVTVLDSIHVFSIYFIYIYMNTIHDDFFEYYQHDLEHN
jgi:hypothetical protein